MKIYSWDGNLINDVTNYETLERAAFYGLPRVRPLQVPRGMGWPLIGGLDRSGGRRLVFDIFIRGGSSDELCGWFDYEDETPKKLIVTDSDGSSNPRYWYGICTKCAEVENSGGLHYEVWVDVHGDIRLRENTASTDTWNITASGQTKVLANSGDEKAYPILDIKPTSGKTGDWAYKIWIPVRWLVDEAFTSYPMDITNDSWDTDALVTASKMQADGDDLRVWVDGVEVDRWLDGIDTVSTKVWVNLDFQAKQEATLGTAIASSGSITEIVASTDISGFPSTGIVIIDSEAFTYTGKSDSTKTFTGVTRAMRGTSMAAHTTTDTIWWVQHDIWILYGNATASAPSVDDDYKPVFDLSTSTNTSWDYDDFGEDDGLRTGAWAYTEVANADQYGGNQGASGDPWVEAGIDAQSDDLSYGEGYYQIWNPAGITNANFQNGEHWADDLDGWNYGYIKSSINGSSWTSEDTISAPSSASTWDSWSDNQALTSGSKYVRLGLKTEYDYFEEYNCKLECSDITLTLNSTYTPTVTVGSEQGNYSLDCTITNNTTGEAIQVTFTMALDDTIQVDTDGKTVTWDADNSSQFQALDIVGDPRVAWLALDPGNNTIQFDDTGTNAVTVDFEWEERFYD